MSAILLRQPIPMADALAFVGRELVRLRAHQVIVWMGLVSRLPAAPIPIERRFPAIIDTGHSHFLSIQERHLVEWAGLAPTTLRRLGTIRERGQRIPLLSMAVFLHRNRPGSLDLDVSRPPFRLGAREGVAIYGTGEFPRLPLLGMQALVENRLRLTVDGDRRTVSLTASPHWWPFIS
jgi:hypothetical protein